jgi:hypothetical protein
MKRHSLALLGLLLVHVATFAKLIFLSPDRVPYATIPWDFASAYSPWLIYIGDCLKSGISPLWMPYVGAGTPFFINPQTQLYSPATLLIGLIFGYSQRITQLQAVGMLYFAGIGAYLLSYSIWRSRWAALITAIGFSLSSAIFSNMEHMTTVNTVALMPWLFWTATMARKRLAWSFPLLAFFVYFLITAGYPGVILMTLIWLSIYILYIIYFYAHSIRERVLLTLRYLAAGLLGLGLAGVDWIPVLIHRKEFTRGTPLSVDQAFSVGSLFFKHLWGAIFMFMTVAPLPQDDLDISMRGMYFGALCIPLALAALMLVRKRIVPALLVLSGCSLLMACGGTFFGRVALHVVINALNLSRFPAADSRALAVLGLTLLAGGGAKLLQENHLVARQFVFRGLIGLLVILAIGLFVFERVYGVETYYKVVLNFITMEMFFLALAMIALRTLKGRKLMFSLVALLALEMGTCALANFNVIGVPVNADDYRDSVASHQRGFHPDNVDSPRKVVGDANYVSEEAGKAYVTKTFYLSEYNPVRLYRFDQLIAKGYADWLANGKRVVALPLNSQPQDYAAFQAQVRPVEYAILSYRPNRVVYRAHIDQDSLIVFNELYFPGWRATIDGQPVALKDLGGLRAVDNTAGEHIIVTSFNPRSFYVGLVVTLTSAIIFIAWIAWAAFRRRRFPHDQFSDVPELVAVEV